MEYLDTHIKGSNSWVIGGQHTESGHPILCNDPHLDSSLPGEWHQIKIYYEHEGEEVYLMGGSMVGFPGIIGKTPYISLALTTVHADSQDLYR